ncbi:GATA transcription factor 9-like [Rutidosis leptorrhynchoides]|uniref:GATA transcription factor 9-like n=1 Tax=Rutidosis leptorrhynchoides TaxID=125765 RepID=UPI003A99B7BC
MQMEESNFDYFINTSNNNNQFITDELLFGFPNHRDVVLNDAFFNNAIGNSVDSEALTAIDSCNSSVSGSEPPFSGNFSSGSYSDSQFSGVEFRLPYDDVAELEWLSSFSEESFTTVDLRSLHMMSTENKAPVTDTSYSDTTTEFRRIPIAGKRINSDIFKTNVFVPCKARSKRSRIAPYDWTSRILHVKISISKIKIKQDKTTPFNRRTVSKSCIVRCLHCGSEKTPQWRTGPLGPKTLCNACGVRYKSGRLVPEYRPAASPTYVSANHSNSHRKVMEIRRQKEIRNAHREMVNRSFVLGGDDCLIDRQSGP